jgi:hypothetical protein
MMTPSRGPCPCISITSCPTLCEFVLATARTQVHHSTIRSMLLQYPLRPVTRPPPEPTRVAWRPANRELVITESLDDCGPHYDTSAPQTVKLKSIKMKSTTAPVRSGLVALVADTDGVYLTPINTVLQMRPDLSYIDLVAQDTALKAASSSSRAEAPRLQAQSRRVDDSGSAVRVPSLQQLEQLRHFEEAKPLSMAIREGAAPQAARRLLVSPASHRGETKAAALSSADLLDSLGGSADATGRRMLDINAGMLPVVAPKLRPSDLSRVPVELRPAALLHMLHCIPHSRALEMLKVSPDDEKSVLSALEKAGHLVRGCWVLRSEVKYSLRSRERRGGANPERKQLIRDLILSLFARSETVDRAAVCDEYGLSRKDVREVLEEVAVLQTPLGGDPYWVWRWSHALGCPPEECPAVDELGVHEGMSTACARVAVRDDEYWRSRMSFAKIALLASTDEPASSSSGTRPAASQDESVLAQLLGKATSFSSSRASEPVEFYKILGHIIAQAHVVTMDSVPDLLLSHARTLPFSEEELLFRSLRGTPDFSLSEDGILRAIHEGMQVCAFQIPSKGVWIPATEVLEGFGPDMCHLALKASAAAFEKGDKARKADIKGCYKDLVPARSPALPDDVAVWALSIVGKKAPGRGGYSVLKDAV